MSRPPNRLKISKPSSFDIRRGINDVLAGEQEVTAKGSLGFFGEGKLDFVSYSFNEYGFLLYWPPTLQRLDAVLSVLKGEGFEEIVSTSDSVDTVQLVQGMQKNFMTIVNGKLFAQVGRDANFVQKLTETLLREVIGFEPGKE